MDLAFGNVRRSREADFNLGARWNLNRLFALLDAVQIKLDDARGSLGPLGLDESVNLDRFALGDEILGRLGRIDGHVRDVLGAQPEDEGRDLAACLAIAGFLDAIEA